MAIVGQGITAYPQPDDALNENSKNPVQNKVVAKEVNELKSAVNEIEYDLESSNYAISNTTTTENILWDTSNSKFETNTAYRVITFPVRRRRTYNFDLSSTKAASTYFQVYSANSPANNVSGTLIKSYTKTPLSSFTESIEYYAENDGYLTICYYKAGGENGSISNIIASSVGLDNRITSVEEKVDDIVGYEISIDYESISSLNFAVDGSAFSVSSTYRTESLSVRAGFVYPIKILSAKAPSDYRVVFSTNKPAGGVAGTLVDDVVTGSSAGHDCEITYIFNAESNGYLSFSHWYNNNTLDGATTLECKEKKVGLIEETEEDIGALTPALGVASLMAAHGNLQKLYCEPEALVNNNGAVIMNQWTELPYIPSRFYLKCQNDIIVSFTLKNHPYSDNVVTATTNYYGNGDIIEIPSIYEIYKLTICHGTYSNGEWIPTEEALAVNNLSEMINNGSFGLYYIDTDILTNNVDIEKIIRALIANNPVISHISDVHGDAIRYGHFMDMSEHMGVLCAINSGDSAATQRTDGYSYLKTAIRKYPYISTLACIGNHDQSGTNAAAYTDFYKMFDDAYDYTLSTDKTYYYKDYPNENLRFIVLNIYEERCNGYSCRISKDQIDWFINTLASTPENYGVIIVAHSSEKVIQKDSNYAKFFSKDIVIDWVCIYDGITGDPVSTIVDAFISKTSITGSYVQEVKESVSSSVLVNETVNYSADFTNVPNSAEFIAYLNGHKHKDMVGYFSGTQNKQLSLNITRGATGEFYKSQDDFPRGNGKGATQDAFNLYAIDRTAKNVIVIRIGSNKTFDMTDRDYMVIPYADI